MRITEAIELLELERPVTHLAVKSNFRRLAKKYHPDRHQNSPLIPDVSDKFIRIREAADLLLNQSEEFINSSRAMRDPVPVVRRAQPRTSPPAAPPAAKLRFIRELDNIIRLFGLLSGKIRKNPDLQIRFQPGVWLGKLYELLFEKQFSSDVRLKGFAFALWRFFRITSGTLFLIAGFLLMSLTGMVLAACVFPPVFLFLGIYHFYCEMLDHRAATLNKNLKRNDRDAWLHSRRQFLQFRTIPVFALLILASSLVRATTGGSWYYNLLSIVFCLPVLVLALSVIYEWLHYYLSQKKA
jgi:hypothetical protein